MRYEDDRLFDPGPPTCGRSFPLVNLADTVYRMSLTVRWQPGTQRANVAYEVSDNDTGELIAWGLTPRTDGESQLEDAILQAREELAGLREYLSDPFPS